MGDAWTGTPIEVTSNTPKDVAALRKSLIELLSGKMAEGATQYEGNIAANLDPLQTLASNIMSQQMYGVPYTGIDYLVPGGTFNSGGGLPGGTGGGGGGGVGGGGFGGFNPNPLTHMGPGSPTSKSGGIGTIDPNYSRIYPGSSNLPPWATWTEDDQLWGKRGVSDLLNIGETPATGSNG